MRKLRCSLAALAVALLPGAAAAASSYTVILQMRCTDQQGHAAGRKEISEISTVSCAAARATALERATRIDPCQQPADDTQLAQRRLDPGSYSWGRTDTCAAPATPESGAPG